jgi:hypothetical protein
MGEHLIQCHPLGGVDGKQAFNECCGVDEYQFESPNMSRIPAHKVPSQGGDPTVHGERCCQRHILGTRGFVLLAHPKEYLS